MHFTSGLIMLALATSTLAASQYEIPIALYADAGYKGAVKELRVVDGQCNEVGELNDLVSSVKTYGATCTLFRYVSKVVEKIDCTSTH